MPSDEMVEKVALAIYDELEGPVANQDFMRQQRQWELAQRLAKAALAAAEAGEQPVASGDEEAQCYPVHLAWSEEDEAWIATSPDLPGCCAVGDSRHEAVREMQDAIFSWIDAAKEAGRSIPKATLSKPPEWAPASPPSEASKGACPVCGCEEVNSRGLWTCECPAPSEASRDERADVDRIAAEMAISSLCGADDGDMSQEWQLSGHQIINLIVMGIKHATAIRAGGGGDMSELREAIARALCRLHIQQVARYDNPPPSEDRIQAGVDNCWEAHLDRADAALAAIEAQGVRLVWMKPATLPHPPLLSARTED